MNSYDSEEEMEKRKKILPRATHRYWNQNMKPEEWGETPIQVSNRSDIFNRIATDTSEIDSPCTFPSVKIWVHWDGTIQKCCNDWTNTDGQIVGDNNWTFWAAPKLGKHINWSIPYFHGVPANFGSLIDETRITFMYNVWRWKPCEPACVEYNLPYEILKGEAHLDIKKDTELPWLEPHGYFNCELEGYPISMQYHGYYQQHKSWMVTQLTPDHIDTTPRFPTQDSQTH